MKTLSAALLFCILAAHGLAADDPVAVRVNNFIVSPSTGPAIDIEVSNLTDKPYNGVLTAIFPEGWRVTPSQQPVDLKPGENKKLPFAIEQAADLAANSYPVTVTIEGGGGKITRQQNVVCASTPYYKPKIDGNLKDWKDAIPLAFSTAGKKTVVRTYWNSRQFCLAVEVEEDKLIGYKKSSPQTGMDAVQFALAPANTVTGGADGKTSARHEFLLAGAGGLLGGAQCYQLMKPGDSLDAIKQAYPQKKILLLPEPVKQERPLKSLLFPDAEVAVKRSGKITRYEVAIPFKALPALRPDPGREYNFSLLVHDAAGTGLRDLGAIMNLTDRDRHPRAWSSWENVQWPTQPPYDNKIEFGFCSSIH